MCKAESLTAAMYQHKDATVKNATSLGSKKYADSDNSEVQLYEPATETVIGQTDQTTLSDREMARREATRRMCRYNATPAASLHLLRRAIPTPRTDLPAIEEEQDRHGEHPQSDEAQHRGRPRHAQTLVHDGREKREGGAGQRADESVGREGAVGVQEVDVDDVVQPLHEDEQDAHADGHAREDLWHPGDVRAAGPREAEQPRGEEGAAEDHGREALLGDDAAVLAQLAGEARLRDGGDDGDAEEDAAGDAEEGEGPHAGGPAALALERDWVGFEKKVQYSVDGGHVDGDEKEDGLEEEHGEGAEEVFRQDLAEVDAGFVELSVEGPVPGGEAEASGAALEDHGGEGLGDDEEAEGGEERDHDEGDPLRPSPA